MIISSYERKYSPGNRHMKCIAKLKYTRDKDLSSQNEPIMTKKEKKKKKRTLLIHILISHALPVLFAVEKAVQPDLTFPIDASTILALLRVKYAQLTPT